MQWSESVADIVLDAMTADPMYYNVPKTEANEPQG